MSEEIKEYTLKFHNTYERLAPNYGYETRKDTKEFDFNSNNGKLMYATVSEIISPLLQKVEQLENIRKETIEYINNEIFKRTILVGVGTKKYTRNILDNILNILNKGE